MSQMITLTHSHTHHLISLDSFGYLGLVFSSVHTTALRSK